MIETLTDLVPTTVLVPDMGIVNDELCNGTHANCVVEAVTTLRILEEVQHSDLSNGEKSSILRSYVPDMTNTGGSQAFIHRAILLTYAALLDRSQITDARTALTRAIRAARAQETASIDAIDIASLQHVQSILERLLSGLPESDTFMDRIRGWMPAQEAINSNPLLRWAQPLFSRFTINITNQPTSLDASRMPFVAVSVDTVMQSSEKAAEVVEPTQGCTSCLLFARSLNIFIKQVITSKSSDALANAQKLVADHIRANIIMQEVGEAEVEAAEGILSGTKEQWQQAITAITEAIDAIDKGYDAQSVEARAALTTLRLDLETLRTRINSAIQGDITVQTREVETGDQQGLVDTIAAIIRTARINVVEREENLRMQDAARLAANISALPPALAELVSKLTTEMAPAERMMELVDDMGVIGDILGQTPRQVFETARLLNEAEGPVEGVIRGVVQSTLPFADPFIEVSRMMQVSESIAGQALTQARQRVAPELQSQPSQAPRIAIDEVAPATDAQQESSEAPIHGELLDNKPKELANEEAGPAAVISPDKLPTRDLTDDEVWSIVQENAEIRALDSEETRRLVRTYIHGVQIGGVNTLVISQEYDAKLHIAPLDAIIFALIKDQRSKPPMIEYFSPEIIKNAENIPLIGGWFAREFKKNEAESDGGYVKAKYYDELAAIAAKEGKDVVIGDVANRIRYYTSSLVWTVGTSLIGGLINPWFGLINAFYYSLSDLYRLFTDSGQFDRATMHWYEIFDIHQEDGRRMYIAQSLRQLAVENQPQRIGRIQELPIQLVVYPPAHALRISRYLHPKNQVERVMRIIKLLVYRASGIFGLDFSIRQFHHDASLNQWSKVGEKSMAIFYSPQGTHEDPEVPRRLQEHLQGVQTPIVGPLYRFVVRRFGIPVLRIVNFVRDFRYIGGNGALLWAIDQAQESLFRMENGTFVDSNIQQVTAVILSSGDEFARLDAVEALREIVRPRIMEAALAARGDVTETEVQQLVNRFIDGNITGIRGASSYIRRRQTTGAVSQKRAQSTQTAPSQERTEQQTTIIQPLGDIKVPRIAIADEALVAQSAENIRNAFAIEHPVVTWIGDSLTAFTKGWLISGVVAIVLLSTFGMFMYLSPLLLPFLAPVFIFISFFALAVQPWALSGIDINRLVSRVDVTQTISRVMNYSPSQDVIARVASDAQPVLETENAASQRAIDRQMSRITDYIHEHPVVGWGAVVIVGLLAVTSLAGLSYFAVVAVQGLFTTFGAAFVSLVNPMVILGLSIVFATIPYVMVSKDVSTSFNRLYIAVFSFIDRGNVFDAETPDSQSTPMPTQTATSLLKILDDETITSIEELQKSQERYVKEYYGDNQGNVSKENDRNEILSQESRRLRMHVLKQVIGLLYPSEQPKKITEIGSAGDASIAMAFPDSQVSAVDIDRSMFTFNLYQNLPDKLFEMVGQKKPSLIRYMLLYPFLRKEVQKLVADSLPNLSIHVEDAGSLSFSSDSFDAAIVQGTPDMLDFLPEMTRVIKQGDYIVAIVYDDHHPYPSESAYDTRRYNGWKEYQFKNDKELERLGLRRVEVSDELRTLEHLTTYKDSKGKQYGAGVVFEIFQKIPQSNDSNLTSPEALVITDITTDAETPDSQPTPMPTRSIPSVGRLPEEQAQVPTEKTIFDSSTMLINDGTLPPENELRVSYVVPIRGEVDNGNFFLQLRDLTRQTGITKDAFEVLYVRNNKPGDIQSQNGYYIENQTILSVIRYIQGVTNDLPTGLDDWQKDIVSLARNSKLRVQTISIPQELLSDTDVEANIEGSRVTGENYEIERYRGIGANGAIVMMDTDTRIGLNTSQQIMTQLVDKSDVGMLMVQYDLIPGEGGEALFKTASHERFIHNRENVDTALAGYQSSGWYAIKADSLGIRDSRTASGSSRDSMHPIKGKSVLATDIRLYSQDRARPGTEGGSFGHQRFLEGITPDDIEEYRYEYPANILLHLYKINITDESMRRRIAQATRTLFPGVNWIDALEKQMIEGDTIYKIIPYDDKDMYVLSAKEYAEVTRNIIRELFPESTQILEEYVEAELKREAMRHASSITMIRQLLRSVYQLPRGTTVTLQSIVGENSQNTRVYNFLRDNQWVIDILQRVRLEYDSQEEAFTYLQGEFPDFLLPFEETEFVYANAMILGTARFVNMHRVSGAFLGYQDGKIQQALMADARLGEALTAIMPDDAVPVLQENVGRIVRVWQLVRDWANNMGQSIFSRAVDFYQRVILGVTPEPIPACIP